MKKYVTVTEQYVSNDLGVKFCVTESECEYSVVGKTVLICDARTSEMVENVRWMICTEYGLTEDDYERGYCGDHEEEYWDTDIDSEITETTETYTFEVEE